MTKTALLAAVLCCAAAASTSARLECGGGLVAVCEDGSVKVKVIALYNCIFSISS